MKIGRNETCPCGSGKKHKKCCYLADQIKLSFARQRKIGTQDEHIKEEPQLIQYFGYNVPRLENESPFDLPEKGLCCMVSSVNRDIQHEINTKLDFPLLKLGKGQWVVTANVGAEIKISGPYDSQDLAMDAAAEKFGAIRFLSTPELI